MKIIIAMAGLGSRFRKVGIEKPKYKIVANGKTLFEWSMLSLADFFDEEFIFVVRREIHDPKFVHDTCEKVGISSFDIIVTEEMTDGQATTVMLANELMSPNDEVVIYNIDTHVIPYVIRKADIGVHYDGYIPVTKAYGDHWSFVRINEASRVVEVAEKLPISNLATIGFYYFKTWDDFVRIYEASKDQIKQKYAEIYIAPMYESYIAEGKHVGVTIVDSKVVHILGTPEEIKTFDQNYLSVNVEQLNKQEVQG